jgi:hypothetical protein
MFNKIFYIAAAVAALAMIALALVWPQGIGAPSPAPFGHEVKLPDLYRMQAEKEERRLRQEAEKAEEEAEKAASESAEASSAP